MLWFLQLCALSAPLVSAGTWGVVGASQQKTSTTSCKDEQGNDVDWFFIYKIPETEKGDSASGKEGTSGTEFVYLDSRSPPSKHWKLSSQSISDPDNPVAYSIAPLYALQKPDKFGYALYNDEIPPSSNLSYTTSGHTKGLILFDGTTGIWLLHSVPKFPAAVAYGQYSYPESGHEFGQTFLCVTYPTSQLDTIVAHLRLQYPSIYDGDASDSMRKDHPGLYLLLHHHYIRQAPWILTAALEDVDTVPFISFAKHGHFNKDVYSEVLAKKLASDLYVSTWQNGPGGFLPSECDEDYKVMNVQGMRLAYDPDSGISFSTRHDHSKWAISTRAASSLVCVGSLNRMHSQFKRGGETVCFKNGQLHRLLLASITGYEKCSNSTN